MEYLKNNLGNSLILPFDIMNDIYEYADTLGAVRKQIENKEYDLEDIMYKKMKKWIQEKYIVFNHSYCIADDYDRYYVDANNIDNLQLKQHLLNDKNGYKDYFLLKHKSHTLICGLEPNFNSWYIYQMIKDLNVVNSNINYYDYDIQELYKLWVKL
jgi:hypothetical protein